MKYDGAITDVYELRSRGRYINYEFYVENLKFERSQKIDARIIEIGGKYKVLYSKNTPKFNKMLLDE